MKIVLSLIILTTYVLGLSNSLVVPPPSMPSLPPMPSLPIMNVTMPDLPFLSPVQLSEVHRAWLGCNPTAASTNETKPATDSTEPEDEVEEPVVEEDEESEEPSNGA